jgi:hypothetical protein
MLFKACHEEPDIKVWAYKSARERVTICSPGYIQMIKWRGFFSLILFTGLFLLHDIKVAVVINKIQAANFSIGFMIEKF